MATRHRLDHDLDPNQHRYLGGRGVDATYSAGGDLTLGQGNYFKVTPTSTATLRRIAGADWTAGSTVVLEPTVTTTFAPGSASGGGLYAITTPTGENLVVEAGAPVAVSFDGSLWRVHKAAVTVPAADDHQVGTSAADITAAKWGPLASKTRGDNLTIEAHVETDPTLGEQVVFSTIAQADPISFASTLYAAHLDDPALFSSVVCAFYKVVGGGANFVVSFNPDYTEWEEIRPGVFKSTLLGQGSVRDYIPAGITPVAGMRVASVNPTEYPMNFPYDEIRTGVYIVTNPGYTGTVGEAGYRVDYAVLERAPELDASTDFASGCVFQVNQGLGAGKYFRMTNTQPIVLGTDELTWEMLDSYTATASDKLLTASQLARASETPNITALVASNGSPSAWLKFPTLAGTPNLDTYRAGRTEAWILARLHAAGSEGSITWLECLVVRDPGGDDATLETINTSPVTNLTDEIIKAHVDDATDQDLAGDGIGLWIRARSDSTTPAAIAVTWSDPAHSTRLLTPMTLAVGGTDDHQALTPASRGFVAGEEAAARARCHPMASIEPGLITWVPGADVATVDGLLTLPPKTNAVRISGTEPLLGVSDTFLAAGSSAVLYVEFASARQVVVSANAPTGFRGFGFYGPLGFSATPYAFLAPANSAMVLYASGGVWNVLSAPWVEPQRALWPTFASLTINTTTAPGLLELPIGCPGVIYVTGTELRAITVLDVDGKGIAGPLAGIQLHFLNACRLYHLDALTGWDAGLAAGAGKLDLLPPTDATGDDCDMIIPARRTLRMLRDSTGEDMLWIPEVAQ